MIAISWLSWRYVEQRFLRGLQVHDRDQSTRERVPL
jgi:hypothetical protein